MKLKGWFYCKDIPLMACDIPAIVKAAVKPLLGSSPAAQYEEDEHWRSYQGKVFFVC